MAYPVKYAALPVLVTRNWDSCLNKTNGSLDVYYVISRCEVLSETTRYFNNQPNSMSYKVRFPYNVVGGVNFEISDNFREELVGEVYDESELDNLKKYILRVNKRLLSKNIYYTNYDKNILSELNRSYEMLVQDFNLIEEELENKLKDELPFGNEISLKRK